MKYFNFITVFFIIFFSACKEKEISFTLPVLITSEYDTIIQINTKKMLPNFANVYGLNIKDSLDLSKKRVFRADDKAVLNSWNKDTCKNSIELFVKNISNFHTPELTYEELLPSPPPPPTKLDSNYNMDSIFKTYKERYALFIKERNKIHYQTLPLYIYNNTNNNIQLLNSIINGDLYFIQEAKDESGKWQPIEYLTTRKICRTGAENLSLKPKHFIVSTVNKYKGEYKTKLRVKFWTGLSIYYSNEYDGEINLSQLNKNKLLDSLKQLYNENSKTYTDKKQLMFLDF